MKVIGYTYDADHHCESCMLDYARKVPTSDYAGGWGKPDFDDEYYHDSPGILNLARLVENEIIRDSEGNAIHPVFDTEEWYANDIYEGNKTATLGCSDCGTILDTWESDE